MEKKQEDSLNAIEFADIKGRFTYWPEESYKEHQKKHPELRDGALDDRIKETKNNPDVIIGSKDYDKCVCFYKLEYTFEKSRRYTKVIIRKQKNSDKILTAYRPDVIKELKYHKPKWIKEGFSIQN